MNFWCFLFFAFGSVEFHFYKKKLSSNGHLKSSDGYICVQIIRVVLGFSLNDFILADEQSQPFLLRYGCHCSRAIFWLGNGSTAEAWFGVFWSQNLALPPLLEMLLGLFEAIEVW